MLPNFHGNLRETSRNRPDIKIMNLFFITCSVDGNCTASAATRDPGYDTKNATCLKSILGRLFLLTYEFPEDNPQTEGIILSRTDRDLLIIPQARRHQFQSGRALKNFGSGWNCRPPWLGEEEIF